MKKILTLSFLLFISYTSYSQLSDWTKYTAPDNSFYALFPGKVIEGISVDSNGGLVTTTKLYSTKPLDNKFFFEISTTDYPTVYHFKDDEELMANRDNFCQGARCTVINTTAIKYANKYPGIEFTAKNATGYFKCQVYVINRRIYMLVSEAVGKDAPTPELDKFLSSFTFLLK